MALANAAQAQPQLAFKSLQKANQREIIILLAKPKEGKTTCALTASEKFTWGAAPGVVDDIGVITFEATALSAMKNAGWEFSYWLDMSEFVTLPLGQFDAKLAEAVKMMANLAAEKKIHTLVVDTVSTLDTVWHTELAKNFEKWGLTDQLNIKHMRFLTQALMSVPCNLVLTVHTKTISADLKGEKKESIGLDPEDTVVMAVGGYEGPKCYRAQASAILPLKRTRGKTAAEDQYWLYPRGSGGLEAGSRYKQLEAVEKLPANMREVFKLIRGAK